MLSRVLATALVGAVLVRPVAGQGEVIIDTEDGAQAAYFALTTTPVGALPSWIAYQLGRSGTGGTGVRAHFGNINEEGDFARRTLAFGVDLSVGGGALGLTAGYHDFSCDEGSLEDVFPGGSVDVDCKGGFVLGANWATPLVRSPLGSSGSTAFVLGLDASLGLGMGDVLAITVDTEDGEESLEVGATSFSAALGVPLLMTARSGNVTFVPHLTPRVAFGHTSVEVDASGDGEDEADESEGGVRAMLGGGLAILFEGSGFGFDVGFQKVFVDEGKMMIGLGVRQLFR